MKKITQYSIVLVTAPSLKVARMLAKAVLEEHLVACVNLVPAIESHYWWQGKIERSKEVLLVMKTTSAKLAALESVVLSEHPYDTPEFVVLPIGSGNEKYLAWLSASLE